MDQRAYVLPMNATTIADPARAGAASPVWPVRLWLLAMAALVFAMVIVGGATRLTDSGLSITEWLPILGAIPPLNDADWLEAFAKYKQIPEYQLVNKGMSLDEFKFIYWWEWAHRFLGRFIGVAFFIPLVLFWLSDRLPRWTKPHLVALFVLGGLQGALGWYMVSSGLVDRVDVSQYRLAAHLSLAVAIFAYLLWLALQLGRARAHAVDVSASAAFLVAAVTFAQIVLGAFVAGLDAGHGYNTWPLMEGSLVPPGLFSMSPGWVNLFENAMTVQFIHRSFAYAVVAMVVNAVLAVGLAVAMGPLLGWIGPAIATTVAAWVMVALLAIGARPMGQVARFDARLRGRIWRILMASAGMGFVIWGGNALLSPFLGLPGWRFLALALLVAVGMVSYAGFGQPFGAFRVSEFRAALRRSGRS